VHGAVVSEVFSDFGFAFDSHFLLNRKVGVFLLLL